MLKLGALAGPNHSLVGRVFEKAIRHGRQVLEGIFKREGEVGSKVPEVVKVVPQPIPKVPSVTSVLKKWTPKIISNTSTRSNLAGQMREHFAARLRSGSGLVMGSGARRVGRKDYRGLANKLTLTAFMGLGMAQGGTVAQCNCTLSHDELCDKFRNLVKHADEMDQEPDSSSLPDSLEGYNIGSMIAKGCDAAVYYARTNLSETEAVEIVSDDKFSDASMTMSNMSDDDSDIEVLPYEEVEFPPAIFKPESDEEDLLSWPSSESSDLQMLSLPPQSLNSECGQAKLAPNQDPIDNYSLAIKMMFNYDVESQALSLTRVMGRELLPAQDDGQLIGQRWETGHRTKMKRLPPHPNIVKMFGGFVDFIPEFPEACTEYPMALPPRLLEDGLGRNATLFLVMKSYSSTLRDYLKENCTSPYTSTLMLTQLVEAVIHISQHNIAHRDLKSNNVLIEDVNGTPRLVVTDFGHSFIGSAREGLQKPYISDDISLGGNSCLMAPEIVCASPGRDQVLDYSKSDLWAVGTLAYEICGLNNPFYPSSGNNRLHSSTYSDQQLPPIPGAGQYLQTVIHRILQRNPDQRPSPSVAAVMLHVLLWAPSEWFSTSYPTTPTEIGQWLVDLTADVVCQNLEQKSGDVEHSLKSLFLQRANINEIVAAINLLKA